MTQQFSPQIIRIQLLLPLQIARDNGAHPPALGVDGLGAGQPGAALRRLEDALPGARHIAVLHGKGPLTERLTGCDRKVGGVAAFGVLHKMGFVQDLHPGQITAPGSVGEVRHSIG